MRLARCEQCKKELRIDRDLQRRFEVGMPSIYFNSDRPETDFCSEGCIVLYYAKKIGLDLAKEAWEGVTGASSQTR